MWLVAGYLVGVRTTVSLLHPAAQELSRNLAQDRDFVLRVLRRELANWMLRRDPDRYLPIYKEAHELAAAISAADHSDQQAQLAKLCKQYPFYADFDLVGSREHVLYADALSWYSYDEVKRHFTDIIRFQTLQIALDENWRGFGPTSATSGDDLAHLEKYVKRLKDTRFKSRLQAAISDFFVYQRGTDYGLGAGGVEPPYETDTVSVRWVPHFAECRIGVHFKDSDEFGLYTTFFYDEPNKEPSSHFYRSNAGFDNETCLDLIWIEEPV
ncbi:MAG: hypothetical protein ACT4O2_09815 [Beijerinckiaceae bacterium]